MTAHDSSAVVTPHAHPSTNAAHGSDAEIAQHIREHHASMVADLDRLTSALRDAPASEQQSARTKVQAWFESVLVPHADEEEATTYRATGGLAEGRPLIEAMVREHVLIKRLVALFGDSEPTAAAAYGRAVFEAFNSHQGKENDVILPLLIDAPQISLANVVGGAHGHEVGEHAGVEAHHP